MKPIRKLTIKLSYTNLLDIKKFLVKISMNVFGKYLKTHQTKICNLPQKLETKKALRKQRC